MPTDPLVDLEAAIKKAARARDEQRQRLRDDQEAKDQHRQRIKAHWMEAKKSLAGIVSDIDDMLKEHGYGGLEIVSDELRHSEIDRVVLEFEHGIRDHSKILLSLTPNGEVTCVIGALTEDSEKICLPIENFGVPELKSVLAQAVARCLGRKKA